jgi:hypothetical protein
MSLDESTNPQRTIMHRFARTGGPLPECLPEISTRGQNMVLRVGALSYGTMAHGVRPGNGSRAVFETSVPRRGMTHLKV